jgi:hypothetical protein
LVKERHKLSSNQGKHNFKNDGGSCWKAHQEQWQSLYANVMLGICIVRGMSDTKWKKSVEIKRGMTWF